MFGATKEYANAVQGLTTRVKPEALRENTSPACCAACCMASCLAGTFASCIRFFLLSYDLLFKSNGCNQTRIHVHQPISHSPFLDQPDDLKRGAFAMNNEIEFIGQMIFSRIQDRSLILVMIDLLDQQEQCIALDR